MFLNCLLAEKQCKELKVHENSCKELLKLEIVLGSISFFHEDWVKTSWFWFIEYNVIMWGEYLIYCLTCNGSSLRVIPSDFKGISSPLALHSSESESLRTKGLAVAYSPFQNWHFLIERLLSSRPRNQNFLGAGIGLGGRVDLKMVMCCVN